MFGCGALIGAPKGLLCGLCKLGERERADVSAPGGRISWMRQGNAESNANAALSCCCALFGGADKGDGGVAGDAPLGARTLACRAGSSGRLHASTRRTGVGGAYTVTSVAASTEVYVSPDASKQASLLACLLASEP